MKLSEIKAILESKQIRLTRSLGQSFLHDQNQLQRIVDQARLQPGDPVLEIGPGLGPLTELLLEKGARVRAIEKDKRLFDFLGERFSNHKNLELLLDDGLAHVKTHRQWAEWKLVSNLPYSVASPILVELAQAAEPPAMLVATLQWEVARRLMATPGEKDYGLLTLLVQQSFVPTKSFKIPASCFFPAPEVDSACLTLERRSSPLIPERQQRLFQSIVRLGFSQRRKVMAKLLKARFPRPVVEEALKQLGLPENVRAEQVSLEQFARLTGLLHTVDRPL